MSEGGAYRKAMVCPGVVSNRQKAVSLTLGWKTQILGSNCPKEHSKQVNGKEDAGLSPPTGIRLQESGLGVPRSFYLPASSFDHQNSRGDQQ